MVNRIARLPLAVLFLTLLLLSGADARPRVHHADKPHPQPDNPDGPFLADFPPGDPRIPSSHARDFSAGRVRFDGEKLVRLTLRPHDDAEELRDLRDGLVFYLESALALDVWGVHRTDEGGFAVDFRCSDEQLRTVADTLGVEADKRVEMEVVNPDIQEAIDRENVRLLKAHVEKVKGMAKKPGKKPPPANPSNPSAWFKEYHPYPEILSFFSNLAAEHPSLATFTPSIGKTYEGRDIAAITISAVPAEARDALKVKQIWWQGMIHAREWISGATVQFLAHKLLTAHADESDPDHTWAVKVLNESEFTIIPTVNPDGYEYTWSRDRMWRKNRRPVTGSSAYGVDLNRNYPDGWGTGGASKNPYSEAYQGPSPLSEPEVKVLTSYFLSHMKRAVLAIDFHSYSQLVLRPLGYSSYPAPHDAKLKAVGDAARDAIRATSGKKYVSEREIDLYAASGTAEDWFYSVDVGKKTTEDRGGNGRVYGFTIELRPSANEGGWGGDGFILPPESIIPVGEEIWAAMKAVVPKVLDDPLVNK
ncbi:hypothetical protein M427DRAFT_40957 [Gonapodya prolifera JEL478]|uniref:Peptidase M14 domain-containing protein n=1 Tax=Gonapodya prolifera (strain JEL478) TaxID=1344416 RepID=A0A139AXY6_GONPJ|nr:hypothetical protein M427DRAFT_40957 [Gonapodya prolifera JEL478]|eukprot:KXS21433.1 hypothetical protein M427DRAFT_40957 [Gonapodya prolifera JEL478]